MSFTESLEICLRQGVDSDITTYTDNKKHIPHAVCTGGTVVARATEGLHSDAQPGLL